jgi:hypothetical protein
MGDRQELEKLLGWIFDRVRDGLRDEVTEAEYEKLRSVFIFHMLDWNGQLKQMAELFENPRSIPKKEACTFVIAFLYHVIPHLGAAGRLLLDDVGDPFAGDELYSVLQRAAYWGVVEECLVRFHKQSRPKAHRKTNQYREQIAHPPSEAVGDPMGQKEPFHLACELAGVTSIDEQERLLSLHAIEYQSICQFQGWQPTCFAGR